MSDKKLIDKIDSTILTQNTYLEDNKALLLSITQFFIVFPETIVSKDSLLYKLGDGELIEIDISLLPSIEGIKPLSLMSIGKQIEAINNIKTGLTNILFS